MTDGPAQILYEYLTASGTDLYTLCGVRCWLGQAPKNANWANDDPALVFDLVSDRLSASGNRRECQFSVRTYGGSDNPDDVETVCEALVDRLGRARRTTLTSGKLERGELVRSLLGLRDPDTEWPYAVMEFEVDFS